MTGIASGHSTPCLASSREAGKLQRDYSIPYQSRREPIMRVCFFSLLCLLGLSFVGCGGDSGPTTVDSSEVQRYVTENPEAVAHQAELEAMAEAEAAAEEAAEN